MKLSYSWLDCLRRGLSTSPAEERIPGRLFSAGFTKNLKKLFPFIARHWRKGLAGGLLVVFTSLLTFPQPLIARFLIDKVILGRQMHGLAPALILLISIVLVEKLLSLFQEFYLARFEQTVILDVQKGLFSHCLSLPKSFFDTQETGYLMSRISTDVQGLRWLFSDTVVQMLANCCRLAGGIAILFYLEWRLALCIFLAVPAALLLLSYFSDKLHILSRGSMEQQAHLTTQLQESISSIPLIKAFASEEKTQRRLGKKLKSILRLSLELTAINAAANFVIGIMPNAARALVLGIGAYWIVNDRWTLGNLLAFQVCLGYVFGPAQFLATANLQIQNARAALERVSSMFDIIPEENSGRGEAVERLSGDIAFQNVSFSYDGRERVLENFSLHVNPGQHFAIVGPSGAGKTTLVSLILRFYRPTEGKILFDGRDADEFDVRSLRRRIGYVAQTTLLLSGSIRDNLRYGNPEASEKELADAARASGIMDFIYSLPEGMDTQIGENGMALSEGQKQRLSIARALVCNPDILILDEPTSSLDRLNEKSIFEALPDFASNKTLFIVTHRIDTIRNCDRILLLNECRTITIGTHDSLRKSSDYYQSLIVDDESNLTCRLRIGAA
ncbi:MAG: ABC transporter ATP-binding protein [Acidobacteria bacterium]|nr:ABC transporter ATP-binding protein [Acidobacteriota bacterium]